MCRWLDGLSRVVNGGLFLAYSSLLTFIHPEVGRLFLGRYLVFMLKQCFDGVASFCLKDNF